MIGWADERTSRNVARTAGRELALVNSVETDGFGWLVRDGGGGLRGPHPTWAAWVDDVVAPSGRKLLTKAIGEEAAVAVDRVIAQERDRAGTDPQLAHGDFDVSQIFHVDGTYSGIIDFGDALGSIWSYDLAHFFVHDTEQNEHELLRDVIAGYEEVAPVKVVTQDLTRVGVLLAVFRHTRVLGHFGEQAIGHPYIHWMSGRIRALLELVRV